MRSTPNAPGAYTMPATTADSAIEPGERVQALRAVEILLRIQRMALDYFPGHDLETVAVLLTVAAGSLAPAHRSDEAQRIMHDQPLSVDWYRPISGRAVAASCGVPRETVRRRLEQLVEVGQIERLEGGYRLCTDTLSRAQNLAFVRALVHELEGAHRLLERSEPP